MTTFAVRAEDLPGLLRSHARRVPQAVHRGLVLAAHRGRAHLVKVTPVDQGLMRNAWRVRENAVGVGPDILNDAPHAGIVERGTRPHAVGKEGMEALIAWAKRHLSKVPDTEGRDAQGRFLKGFSRRRHVPELEKKARAFAFAIAAKIKREGQKGTFIVETSVPLLARFAAQEVLRQVVRELETSAGGKGR